MEQLTKEEAINFGKSEKWKTMSDYEIVEFQLFNERLCMPFGTFQKAMESVFKRPIMTHELIDDKLKKEFKTIKTQ